MGKFLFFTLSLVLWLLFWFWYFTMPIKYFSTQQFNGPMRK